MTLRSLPALSLFAFLSAPAFLSAQIDTSAKEDERMAALAREPDGWYAPKNKVSVGVRILSSGARIDFQNLGTIPSVYTVEDMTGVKNRAYSDGNVLADAPLTNEKDANGIQTSTPGGRYQVTTPDANGNPILAGDYLSYTPGLTRQWAAADDSQIDRPGYVAFHIYSTTSDGGSMSRKQGATGGVEFQISRDLGRGSRHFQFSMLAGVSLTDINGKSSGTVNATLNTYTDYYSLNGLPIDADHLTNPSTVTKTMDDNGVQRENVIYETTVPISATPDASISGHETPIVGGAQVNGHWQVKGAYLMVKVGPSIRTQLTDRLGLSASLGLAGGYAGTRYTASESFSVANLPDVIMSLTDEDTQANVLSSTTAKFLTGYFADVNLEWAANETFGLFGGVTAQQLTDYEQKLGDRVAKVDLGSAVGIRGGVTIKF